MPRGSQEITPPSFRQLTVIDWTESGAWVSLDPRTKPLHILRLNG